MLVVRHGEGRGRLPRYLQECLDALGRSHPAIARRLRVHHTGSPAPELGAARAVVFWLADPLRESYPTCYAEACTIADAARARGIRIVNPPEALSNSVKSVQAALWQAAGVPTPAHRRFAARSELEACLPTVSFPAIVRADDLHGQWHMHVCRTADEALAVVDQRWRYPGSIAPLVDTRADYRQRDAPPPWSAFFHKKRVFVFGDVLCPTHLYFSDGPIVAQRTSTLYPYRKLRRRGRLIEAQRRYGSSIAADLAYVNRAAEHGDLMRRAARVLGLDFMAIDYASTADGGVVLWEANPYFHLPPWYANPLPVKRRLWRRFRRFHDSLAAFFRSLLDAEPSGAV